MIVSRYTTGGITYTQNLAGKAEGERECDLSMFIWEGNIKIKLGQNKVEMCLYIKFAQNRIH
jgi:hypothetical protein